MPRDHRDAYQGISDLIDDVSPYFVHRIVMEGPSISDTVDIEPVHLGGAWAGGYTYYSMLANL